MTAPLNLIYVAHGERMTDVSPEDRRLYASVGRRFTGQNVVSLLYQKDLRFGAPRAADYVRLDRRLKARANKL